MKVRDVLTAEPQTVEQIGALLDVGVPPWKGRTPLTEVRDVLAWYVESGVAVRVSLPVGDGWRLAGAS